MVSVGQELRCLFKEVFLEIGYLATYAHSAQSCLSSDIRVGGCEQGLNFGEQITRHLKRGDVSQCTESQSDDILVRVLEITAEILKLARCPKDISGSRGD
jgi:hypothetical protein